jgi:hypothetical protein
MPPRQTQGQTALLSQEASSRRIIFNQHTLWNFRQADNGKLPFSVATAIFAHDFEALGNLLNGAASEARICLNPAACWIANGQWQMA